MDIKDTNPGTTSPKQQPNVPLGQRSDDPTWEAPEGEQDKSNREGEEESEAENRDHERD